MKQRFKKAAAILLSAAMCLGMVAQAAPGISASPERQTEKEAEPETKVPESKTSEAVEKQNLILKNKGDAYANIYDGSDGFEEAITHKSTQ